MTISITNYKKNIASNIQKLAKLLLTKNAVREIDEEPKDSFVAYVDDGDESYDVNLVFNDKKGIIKHSCDCKNEYFFCEHQTALLMHLIDNGTSVKPALKLKKTKKEIEIDTLFANVTLEQIKAWLITKMDNDKAFKLEFETAFKSDDKNFTVVNVVSKTKEVVKAIAKTKKNIDNSQVTSIFKIWDPMHQQMM